MKLILLRDLNPFFDSSASGNRFASLVTGLKECGVDITIAVTRGYNNPYEKKTLGREVVYKGIHIVYVGTTLNHTLWRRRVNKYMFSYLNDLLLPYKLNVLLKDEYDYVWVTYNYSILNYYVKYHKHIRNSLIEINEFHNIYKQIVHSNRAQLVIAQKTEQVFLKAVKHITTFAIMTRKLLDYHKTISNKKGSYLHLPMTVDMSRFTIAKDNGVERYIAFAGSLANRKDGVDILIEAFKLIATKYPDVKLYLAGNYHPDMKMQKTLIEKYGLQNRVKYCGLLSRDEIPAFFVNATVLALPRPDSHQAQGGFPTKLGEYLATCNPVCATKVGEIPDYLEDNVSAFMATPGCIDSFADALDRALANREMAQQIGRMGYYIAKKNFDMEIQTKRLYDFLNNNLKK